MTSNQAVKVDVVDNKKNKGKKLADKSIRAFVDVNKVKDLIGGDLEEAVKQLQTEMENAISKVQQDYGIPHYSLYDLPDGTGWNSTTSDNFSVLGVDSPSDLFQGQCPPFVLDCSQLGSYTDDDGGMTTVYNILMESDQLFVDEALVEMFIGETFIPSKDDISRGTRFIVIIQRDGDGEVVLRTMAHIISLN